METITINEIKRATDTLVIVKFNRLNQGVEEATMNTKWQEQLVDYLEKDVGIGGSVSVMIEQKGKYTNITSVDLTSAKKGTPEEVQKAEATPTKEKYRTPEEMIACEFVKCAAKLARFNLSSDDAKDNEKLGKFLCMAVIELHGAYKVALDRLK